MLNTFCISMKILPSENSDAGNIWLVPLLLMLDGKIISVLKTIKRQNSKYIFLPVEIVLFNVQEKMLLT